MNLLFKLISIGVNYRTPFFAQRNYNYLCYYLPLVQGIKLELEYSEQIYTKNISGTK